MIHYYKVTSGPVFALLEKIVSSRVAAFEAAKAWADKHQLPVAIVSHELVRFIEGFIPNRKVWKPAKNGFYRPRISRPEGKMLLDELRALPKPAGWDDLIFSLIKGTGKSFTKINQFGAPGMKKIGAHFLLASDPYWLPSDRAGIAEITATEWENPQP